MLAAGFFAIRGSLGTCTTLLPATDSASPGRRLHVLALSPTRCDGGVVMCRHTSWRLHSAHQAASWKLWRWCRDVGCEEGGAGAGGQACQVPPATSLPIQHPFFPPSTLFSRCSISRRTLRTGENSHTKLAEGKKKKKTVWVYVTEMSKNEGWIQALAMLPPPSVSFYSMWLLPHGTKRDAAAPPLVPQVPVLKEPLPSSFYRSLWIHSDWLVMGTLLN